MSEALLTFALSYLVGSLPFSYLVARWAGIADIRKVGSGNVGATNVMRAAGRLPGVLAFVLDAAKGALAVAAARAYAADGPLPAVAAVGAVVGHCYSVFLRLRGGKGAATGAGAFVPIDPLAALGAFLTFGGVLAASRYVSVASMAGAVALALLLVARGAVPSVALAGVLLASLVVYRHRENIQRLRNGSERRLGRKA